MSRTNKQTRNDGETVEGVSSPARYERSALTIDWSAYEPLLMDESISEKDRRELLETLWSIVVAFVDLGFGIHPAQHARGDDANNTLVPVLDLLYSDKDKNDIQNKDPLRVLEHVGGEKEDS